jgi:twitching motility protein PilT
MLRELARQDVTEFAVVSDRLPCIKVAGKYEPIDDKARSSDDIREMLLASGGRSYIADMANHPVAWTTRMEGLGSIGIQAVERDGRIQARFTVVRRPSVASMQAVRKSQHPPARKSVHPPPTRAKSVHPPPTRKSSSPAHPQARRSQRAMPAVQLAADDAALERASQPKMKASPAARANHTPGSLDGMLADAAADGASDVHVIAGRPLLARIGGDLLPRGDALEAKKTDGIIHEIVPERLRAVLEEQGSCDFALDRGDVGRFRVNVSRQRTGLKACFRLIRRELPTLASLGLPAEIERATHHHQGLVVVTGPTGHGKTCTMAAIVDIINRETTHHIITVEDPVEYLHPRKKAMISQREVGSHTKSFANALKASLREDPDVIVVGELRDTETVRMALAASETGHLVLGTMNTPSAAKTIDRLVDLFPSGDQQQVRMTLAGGLHLIVSQRLVPTVEGKDVVAAVELLPGSVALWSLIRDNKTFQIPSLQQRGKGFGIVRLDDSLYELVKAGRITKDSAVASAEYPEELAAVLSGKRPAPGAVAAALPGAPQPAPPKQEERGGLLGKAGQLFGRKG